METGQFAMPRMRRLNDLSDVDEDGQVDHAASQPLILQPPTPKEPIEFLSRSWSLSAEELSKALANKYNQDAHLQRPSPIPETITSLPLIEDKVTNSTQGQRMGSIGKLFHHKDSNHGWFKHKDSGHGWLHHKDSGHGWFHHKDSGHGWFHHKESNHGSVKKKDRARAENAHMHAAVSVAGLAAAVAAIAAEQNSNSGSKMSQAVASAAELLATQCIEIAEQTTDHEHVTSVVRSAVDIRTAGDLMTLTAAAATALRGEAALRARLPKEARRNAAISPYERHMTEAHNVDPFHHGLANHHQPYVGELQLQTEKGGLQSKHVSVYVNKKSQVMIKLKCKHLPGAFSQDKRQVYGVSDHIATFSVTNKECDHEETCFGLETAQGFLKFKCNNKSNKQQWVDRVQNLLNQVGCLESMEHSMGLLNVKGCS
ncbi:VAN3-binding protein-like protein [Drosera capensis]